MIRPSDFRHIRLALAAALAMLLAGAAVVAYLANWHKAERRLSREADAAHREIQLRLARAREEEAEIKAKIDRFNGLLARGIIGEEHRLDWVEQIRRIRTTRRLLDLSYEIAPQTPIDPLAAPGTSGAYEFYASPMQLRLPLLHEGDLVNFLGDLEQSASAFIRPRSCTVERAAPAAGTNAQLRADCVIDWITVRERTPAG